MFLISALGDGPAGLWAGGGRGEWCASFPVLRIKGLPTSGGFLLCLQEIEGASHHVYADQPHIFNSVVEEICDSVD